MRFPVGLVVSLYCLSMPLSALADTQGDKLYLYTENYGTFNYSVNGRDYEHWRDDIGGTSTALVKAILEESGLDYRMRLRTWRVGYERALERPNHGVFSTARTPQREDRFHWVGPIANYNWVVFGYKGSIVGVDELSDLKHLKVGGYDGSAATIHLQSKGIDVSTLPNDSLNPQRLAQGLIDVWIASDTSAYDIAKASGHPDIVPLWTIRRVDMYLAMNRETPIHVIERLNDAYLAVVKQGN